MTGTRSPDLSPASHFRQIPSLLGAPIAEFDDVGPGDICMVGLFEDHADGTQFGARFAARQMRYASDQDGRQADASFRQMQGGGRAVDLGDLNVFPLDRERNGSALVRQLKAIIDKGAIPVVVGGAFPLGPLMKQAFEHALGQSPDWVALPTAAQPARASSDRQSVVLTVDLSAWGLPAIIGERPLARLRQSIEALPPESIRGVHLTGLAPKLDLCGRRDSDLGRHVLHLLVAHLMKAGA